MGSTTARRLGVGVLVAGVALSAAACGSSKKSTSGGNTGGGSSTGATNTEAASSPQDAFTQAIGNITSGDSATVTLKIGATADQIKSFAAATGTAAKDVPSDATLALITGASLTFTTHAESGDLKTASTTGKTDTDVAVNVGGGAVFDIRYIGGSKQLFVKVDVPKIASLAHQTVPPQIAQLGASPQYAFIKDALAGKWLELQGFGALAQQFGGLAGGASASAAPSGVSQDFAAKLLSSLSGDVTATDAGSTDQGEHLVLAAPLKKLAGDVETLISSVPGGSLAGSRLPKLSDVPDKTVMIDAYVKDHALTSLSLDIVQFAPADKAAKVAGQHLPIELDFSGAAGDTGAPSGASPVDLSKLAAQFGPLLGSQLGG